MPFTVSGHIAYFEISYIHRKCYYVCDQSSSKHAQKGVKARHQNCRREEFLEALYNDRIPVASYNQLNWNKHKSQMAVTPVTKPALSIVYTKFRVRQKIICQPYED